MSETRTSISAAASPAITVSIEEADRLAGLAELASRSSPEVVRLLLDEIDRAEQLPWGDMPTDVVTMHMHVEYRDDETSADAGRGGADWSVCRTVDPVAEAGWAQTIADGAAGVVAAAR